MSDVEPISDEDKDHLEKLLALNFTATKDEWHYVMRACLLRIDAEKARVDRLRAVLQQVYDWGFGDMKYCDYVDHYGPLPPEYSETNHLGLLINHALHAHGGRVVTEGTPNPDDECPMAGRYWPEERQD